MIVHRNNFMEQAEVIPGFRDLVDPVVDRLTHLSSNFFNFLSPQQAPEDKIPLDKKIEHCSEPSHLTQNIFVCGVGAIIMLSMVLNR